MGCGNQIGDACFLAIDCSPNGDRICVDATANTEGYCTIQGCDLSTCPDEAVCVRFFAGSFAGTRCVPDLANPSAPNAACSSDQVCSPAGVCVVMSTSTPCDPKVPDSAACSLDEICSVAGVCVAEASEVRYCMLACESDGDCRDGYECRDLERMKLNGGQPLLDPPGAEVTASAPKFCAKAP